MDPTKLTTKVGIGVETEGLAPAVGGKEGTTKVFFGRVVCAVGLISAVVGAFSVDVSLEVVGIVLGALGYALDASKLGILTIVFSTIALVFLLAAGQGYVPGPWPIDSLAL
ncbi:MAG: hypothetical protein AVDCRST_MAG28-3200 [uncultured Rubrobacteraceae bacterium]|uniref:Uncharacterized protein n=1 Tax=uncultured Rubrobacteraceae bacterium TaxID=349277 RepID=A0A6J4R1Z6_9ACTN|nr:MAG: hypothetical protein AVDCRST_MAG28-3200 [uncultured Rubrobacteraceae bacterium]